MKASQFKKILKPLVEQTVKEVLLEEPGILSKVISEVARGLQGGLVVESVAAKPDKNELRQKEEAYEKERQKRIKRLNESAQAKIGVDVFENTKQAADSPSSGALSGVSPEDAGVDIAAIERLSKGKWKNLI